MDSVIYSIPCGGCPAVYYGETSRGIKKRFAEHKNDLWQHRTTNSLVRHVDEYGHLPDWENARALCTGLEKRMRRLVESAFIAVGEVTNHREGFVNLSRNAAQLVINSVDQPARFLPKRPVR